MKFALGAIEGVIVRDLAVYSDRRGWLTELFRSDELVSGFLPVMAYVSATNPGVTRGPHEHQRQSDLFCFVGPSTFRIVCWDNRKGSPTFRRTMVLEGGAGRPLSLLVPPGVVHAYKNIGSTEGWVMNFPDALYGGKERKEQVDEIRHEDDPESEFRMEDFQ